MSITLINTCRRVAVVTSATLLLTNVMWASPALARPRIHIRPMPLDHSIIHVGPLVYFFLDGHFYRHGPHGYMAAPPPIGAVIATLPYGSIPVKMDGELHYTYSGVFYKQVREGYMVVAQPGIATNPDIAIGQKLKITVDLLNVRSGPGLGHEVVQQICRGSVVKVEALSSNWCLIRMENNRTGWIKNVYTSPLPSAAKG